MLCVLWRLLKKFSVLWDLRQLSWSSWGLWSLGWYAAFVGSWLTTTNLTLGDIPEERRSHIIGWFDKDLNVCFYARNRPLLCNCSSISEQSVRSNNFLTHDLGKAQYSFIFYIHNQAITPSRWQRDLRLRSAAARLLGLWVRIPSGAWISVSCECCV